MDRVMCQKRLAVYAANSAVLLHVLGAFVAIGAIVAPFAVVTVPQVQCPNEPLPILPGGTLSFAPSTYEVASTGGSTTKLIKYSDNTVVYAGYLQQKSSPPGAPPSATWNVDPRSCATAFAPGPGFPPLTSPYPLCSALNTAATLGNIAVALLATGLVLLLTAAVLVTLRACRLRSSLPGSTSDDSKGCHTRGTTTLTLSFLALLCYLVAFTLLWFSVLPLSSWYVYSLGFSRDPWLRDTAVQLTWAGLTCAVTASAALGPGFGLTLVSIGCAALSLALDFFSHCCCKSDSSNGCLTNANYWWVLPDPAKLGPAVVTDLPAALGGAGKGGSGGRGTPRAAAGVQQQQAEQPQAQLLEEQGEGEQPQDNVWHDT